MSERIVRIIAAQIKYTIYNLQGTIIIFLGILIYAYFRQFNPLNILSFLLFVQYSSLVLLSNNKEKRDYTFLLLTLSTREIAFSRVFLVYLGFLFIYFISFGMNYLIFNPGINFRDGFHELFMFGGFGLLGIFLYLILTDYFSIFRNRTGFVLFNISVIILLGIIGFGIIYSVVNTYENSNSYVLEIISLIYLCSFILSVTSILTYQKRESYLGY
jgi:hypothetical protein